MVVAFVFVITAEVANSRFYPLSAGADMLVNKRNKQSWQRVFATGRDLYQGLAGMVCQPGVFSWIMTWSGGPGAARGVYADFLDEAATILAKPNYNALAIGFGPTERASEAIFSIAVYPKKVNLCLLQGGKSRLNDPNQLLEGSGTSNRFIHLKAVTTLDDPAVQDLMAQALHACKVPLGQSRSGRLIIKSVSAKQRARRPN
jgi:hypothetical protein